MSTNLFSPDQRVRRVSGGVSQEKINLNVKYLDLPLSKFGTRTLV